MNESGHHPMVSVLMTCYNREQYVPTAIESVLAQSFQDWELVIVDDQSTDRSMAIAQEYAQRDARIRVYRNAKNLGDYPNRNQAASYARGKYLKYVDSDDAIYPHCLAVMVFVIALVISFLLVRLPPFVHQCDKGISCASR